jgi:hypothetical protein
MEAAARDELHVRRERTRLLAAFDRRTGAGQGVTPVTKRHWLRGTALAAALVCALTLALVQPWRSARAQVHALPDTSWSQRSEAGYDLVELEHGSLWIHVEHGARYAQPLKVVLPDGELFDQGTTFEVSAASGRTLRVTVQSGRVELRVWGLEPVTLEAGDTWQPAEPRLASEPSLTTRPGVSEAVAPEPVDSVHEVASVPSAPPERELHGLGPAPEALAVRAKSNGVGERVTPAVPDTRAADADFRSATDALRAGNAAQAAAAFARFLLKYPRDPRAQDAAYLQIVSLQRSGDVSEMKKAANAYLQRFADGFRRVEVERLAR